jgi:dihydroorotase-like cyclic amidohydrolase
VPLWRSRTAELTAISVAALLARLTRARAVIAHISHPEALAIIRREVQAGANVVVETCPQYLHCLEQEVLELGALRKFTPPARARSQADLDAMWDALAGGMVDYVSTDHAPSTREQKARGSIWDVHFGLPGIDTTLPFLLDAASRGRISHEKVVDLYSSAPSRVYGLRGKGRVQVGADADLVLVDPAARWTVKDEDVLSRARWSPFSGATFVGRPVQTYLRGELAMDEGRVLGEPGTGRFVPGPGSTESR